MVAKALILNKFDIASMDGIQVDIDLCRFFRVECYPIITGVTKNYRPLMDFRPEDVIKQIESLGVVDFNALKLEASVGISVIDYVESHIGSCETKVLTLNAKSILGGLTYEYLNQLSNTELFRSADLIVLTSEEAEHLLKVCGITSKPPKELMDSLSKVLGVKRIALINHREGGNYINILRRSEHDYLELRTATYLPKDLISSYLMVGLINKVGLEEALINALEFAGRSLEYGVRRVDGVVPEVYASSVLDAERYRVIKELSQAISTLEENSELVIDLLPEVQMNIAYSLPKHLLRSSNDIAAIPGRITRVGNSVKAVSYPEFGASRHLARALMKAMEYEPEIRSVANIRFDERIIKTFERLGYTVSFYDRSLEPPEVKSVEGGTIPWGVEEAIRRVGSVPDVIYHRGDYGKEAMIVVLGRSPNDVVRKLMDVGYALKGSGVKE